MFGFNQGEIFLKNNLHKYDLCCVQEHWLHPSTLNNLANINPDFAYHAVSQMLYDDLLSPGRLDHMVILLHSGKRNYLQ